ncbi:type I polyketide synthase [Dietzia sp. B19]|uniref:type I polyketide synthase n=1 Tax=Dietzia sp. B19 TaxID=1630632 RepID=UPI001F50AAC9|nr:type I polyketide synthase [Dietzia sp. B19]
MAITAVACRLPGGVATPDEMWQVLSEGRDLVGDFPTDRGWNLGLYNEDPDVSGTFYTRGGGFLEDSAMFDAEFFGVSPREAVTIDPQQRLLLETAWEVIESSGYSPNELRGSRTGVYIGASYNDYGSRPVAPGSEHEGYLALGSASSVASGRLSYTFGLEGPAVTVDTACSSSLVALQLACTALATGSCDRALVGGAAIMSTLTTFVEFSRQRAMSPDGRCKAFGAAADGAGWAEGVGMVMVEPLETARAAGRPVLAVVKGIAANQDGASNGLTAPSGIAQQRVIHEALRDAGAEAGEVDLIEAHGTGTQLGDPIEAEALTAVYGAGRDEPLWLGSLKSNTGHTQAAAGILALIKVVLALRHDWMPATLHADSPSDFIDWDSTPLSLTGEGRRWPRHGRRLAGVSAFGISGTNVHVIVGDPGEGVSGDGSTGSPTTQAPTTQAATTQDPTSAGMPAGLVPVPVVARSRAHLVETVGALARTTRGADLAELGAVARGFGRRAHLGGTRVLLLLDEDTDLVEVARAVSAGEPHDAVIAGSGAAATDEAATCWVFSGQGSQCPGMGTDLMATVPRFAESMGAVLEAFDGLLDFDLAETMRTGEGLDRTERSQPAIFAVQVALARTLLATGVKPASMIGHSIGEYAALHIAGVLDLQEACRLVAARGRLMGELPVGGAMCAVRAGREDLADLLGDEVVVAVENSERSLVISGPSDEVDRVAGQLSERGVRVRRLAVSHAFHSPLMEPMLAEFRDSCADVGRTAPIVPVISTVTGEPMESVDGDYLVRQVREPVIFARAVESARAGGADVFLEIGPRSVLSSQIMAVLDDSDVAIGPVQREDRSGAEALLAGMGMAWVAGAPVDFTEWWGHGEVRVPPVSPFDRRRYWLDAEASAAAGAGGLGLEDTGAQLLRARIDVEDRILLTGSLSAHDTPWSVEHVVRGRSIVPGTAMLELALEAGRVVGRSRVDELVVLAPLEMPSVGGVSIRVVLTESGDGYRLEISSTPGGEQQWRVHAVGALSAGTGTGVGLVPEITFAQVDGLYERMSEGGFDYGTSYRGLEAIARTGDGAVAGRAVLPDTVSDDHMVIHPALLDAGLHTLAFVDLEGLGEGLVPFAFEDVEIGETDRSLTALLTVTGDDRVSVRLYDSSGVLCGRIGGLRLRPADALDSRVRIAGSVESWVDHTPVARSRRPAPVMVDPADPGSGPREGDRVLRLTPTSSDPVRVEESARSSIAELLPWVQWAARSDGSSRLVVVTTDAAGDRPDLGHAAATGLVRTAQSEHPGRFAIVHAQGDIAGEHWPDLLELTMTEPEIRVDERGATRVRRVHREWMEPRATSVDPAPGGPVTTVVTGASGVLGRSLAEHLGRTGQTDSLLLLSRRGRTPELEDVERAMTGIGVHTELIACDVADPDQVSKVFADASANGRPVTDVVHAAGVLDDAIVTELDPGRFDRVLRTKLGGASNVCSAIDPARARSVVFFSSVAGVFGGSGQGSYAAANVGLDALARTWTGQGLPVQSMDWGVWEQTSAMTAQISEAGATRVARSGIEVMTNDRALALFDELRSADRANVIAADFDVARLAELMGEGGLPRALADLVEDRSRPGVEVRASLRDELSAVDAVERTELLLRLVRQTAARVIGLEPSALPVDDGLLDAGFDSLTAVELRNQLAARAEVALPATLLFDYPSVRSITTHLEEVIGVETLVGSGEVTEVDLDIDTAIGALELWLAGEPTGVDDARRGRIAGLVTSLDRALGGDGSDDELFDLIEQQLGE